MGNSSKSRKRAGSLTPEALELVKERLLELWNRDKGSGKLTREVKSEMLGLSVATSERILNGKGADRPSMLLAFKNLGLAWDDAYFEYLEATPEVEVEAIPVQLENRVLGGTHRTRWTFAVAGVIIVASVMFLGPKLFAGPEVKPDWRSTFTRVLLVGSNAFHQGDYTFASQQMEQAISLAREHQDAVSLASALRVAGDLAAAKGDLVGARERYEEALTLRGAFEDKRSVPALMEALGDLYTKQGDLASAQTNLLMAMQGYKEFDDKIGIAMVCRDLGTVALRMKNPRGAHQWLQKSLDALEGFDKPDIVTDVQGRMALVQASSGNFDAARKALAECLAYWTAKKHLRWMAVTRLQMGQVEAQAGDSNAAKANFQASLDGFSSVGDRLGVKEAEQGLAAVR